ncbi:tetratricopeptide repeat protein 1 [Nematolebias whitei]|uniref:tetratricopeptide repeat protein 1 n=1 Tax=Nematolebias whitei TaxID=451745 RepID=UPI00189B345B|nr:tetratricopeptide repeat protein 1 [Nematolebias whitei]
MSSRGEDPGGQEEGDEEDFYDCHDILKPPEITKEKEQQKEGDSGLETQQEDAGSEDCDVSTNRQIDRKEASDTEGQKNKEVAQGEKEQGAALQEDSDSELKEDVFRGMDFDDDYLREVEKELTEEEKQIQKQRSLTLKETGNGLFKAGDWSEAALKYTEALALCPISFSRERAVLFSNRAAARLHLEQKDEAISDCSRAIELDPDYLRALLRRAEIYEQTEKLDEAMEDYKKVLDRDPNHTGARQACMRLPQQIHERNEKLKEEMMSKLKDLGNMILRPFGLSTNNFQVNQDTASGSYSINFVQNPNR